MILPSKTFVIGEYSILSGSCALLLAHAPLFRCEPDDTFGQPFPDGSPAAAVAEGKKFQFIDPHAGIGGFGASGAEFLGALATTLPNATPWEAREEYFARGGRGSGADILVQQYCKNRETPALLVVDPNSRTIREIAPGLTFQIFHTGTKLKTHEHISEKPSPPPGLGEIARDAILAVSDGHHQEFFRLLAQFQNELNAADLLAAHSARALAALGGKVAAAKGCGALGSDVLLVVGEKPADLTAWAKEFSLKEIVTVRI